MIGAESTPEIVDAAGIVGVVLVEAIVLYVGYGAFTRAVAPSIQTALQR